MPVNKLIFEDAEKARDAITASQKKEIAKLYENWAAEIGERAKYYSHKSAPSYAVAERQMKELMKQMEATSHEVANEIYTGVKKNIYLVADSVVQQNVEWLKSLGFAGDTLDAAFNYIPDEIVRNIITGQIYDSGWSLSKRIWSDNEDTMKTAYQIVAGGMAQNKSIYEIAKDLESYVEPGAKKPWNLTMKDGRKIYPKQVDYNAQRLARTLVQHGYQQSFKATTEKNPFIEAYKWNANGSRVCDLCMERETTNMHGLGPGIYPKDQMPMDHPNGMCTMEPVVVDNLVDQLADWFNNPDGTYPEIDEFASNFGYDVKEQVTMSNFLDKWGTSTKSPAAWFNSLTQIQKAEASQLKEASGMTWNKWYEKNIYVGDGSNLGGKKKVVTEVFDKSAWLDILHKNDLKTMQGWCSDWEMLITSEERYGVEVYTGSAYRDMNKYLRGISKSTSYSDEIKYAKSALKKASLPEDTVVRRGSDFGSLKAILKTDKGSEIVSNKDKFIGAVVQDKGFMSTSPDPYGGFNDDITYVIKVPKGTDAMYVAPISRHSSENELLLNAGTKFIVEDFEIDSYDVIKKVFLRVLK